MIVRLYNGPIAFSVRLLSSLIVWWSYCKILMMFNGEIIWLSDCLNVRLYNRFILLWSDFIIVRSHDGPNVFSRIAWQLDCMIVKLYKSQIVWVYYSDCMIVKLVFVTAAEILLSVIQHFIHILQFFCKPGPDFKTWKTKGGKF